MDFSLSEEQQALSELVGQIFTDQVTPERLDALDSAGEWLDRSLWQRLAASGVLGVALPEHAGGAGAGFVELYFVLEAAGAAAAQVPLWPTLVLGAAPIAEFGGPAAHDQLLKPVSAGECLLTAALPADGRPAVTAEPNGAGWRLDGVASCVPIGNLADRVLVPAAVRGDDADGADRSAGSVVVAIVDPRRAGVAVQAQESIGGEPVAEVAFSGLDVAEADLLAGPDRGAAVLTWMLERAWTGLAALQAGVCRRAVRMSAEYTSGREQFGRPIASFQAVGQRLGDAYIDTEGVRLTALQAAWRLGEGLPAADEVAIAKWWAGEAGHRVLHAAQHVHGGVGVDLDYPLHRYFRLAKQIEFALGSSTAHLVRLGESMARERA